mmetsp:Transcript_22992/g.35518  ORF Transcript_22992/g.35518 Transcript_22992/m.35518 type:complete len:343 (+) Transcript_22992:1532-2560(+)
MVLNNAFFTEVFMNPLFHLSSFYFGMMMSLVYLRFKEERLDRGSLRNSFSSRFLEMICNNAVPRYILYFIALLAISGAIFWQTPFIAAPADQSQLANTFYATLSYPLFLGGLTLILMPALGGKAEVFRFFYGSQTWTLLSAAAIELYYMAPFITVFYFMATQHQITVTYYMFVYYFTGNFIFGMALTMFVANPIDRPIISLINLKRDIRDAERSQYYKITDYVENFKDGNLFDEVQVSQQIDSPRLVNVYRASSGQRETQEPDEEEEEVLVAGQAQEALLERVAAAGAPQTDLKGKPLIRDDSSAGDRETAATMASGMGRITGMRAGTQAPNLRNGTQLGVP